jgi:hypothetical protein
MFESPHVDDPLGESVPTAHVARSAADSSPGGGAQASRASGGLGRYGCHTDEVSTADDELPGGDDPPFDDPPHDGIERDASPAATRSRVRGSLVAAAMLGLGQVIEPEKTKVVIEQTNDDPFGDADLELSFDRLPSVDDP